MPAEAAAGAAQVGGALAWVCRAGVADRGGERVGAGGQFQGVVAATVAQGVGDELGDHQDEGVGHVRAGREGEAVGEGAGGPAGLADAGCSGTGPNAKRSPRSGPPLVEARY